MKKLELILYKMVRRKKVMITKMVVKDYAHLCWKETSDLNNCN